MDQISLDSENKTVKKAAVRRKKKVNVELVRGNTDIVVTPIKVVSIFLFCSLLLNGFLMFHINDLQEHNTNLIYILNNFTSMRVGDVSSSPDVDSNVSVDYETVNIALINDRRCLDCNVTELTGTLRRFFPTASIKFLDYSEPAAKDLYDRMNLTYLPAVIFDRTVLTSSGYQEAAPFLEKVGDYYNLFIGAFFDPTAEICDNGIDDTGNGLVDCEDPDCFDLMVCNEEVPGKLELYTMSMCPYGMQAINSLKSVFNTLVGVDFGVNYIVGYGDGFFDALHGQDEVDESIRQLCINKYNSSAFLDYVYCRNKDISADWSLCADGLDMDKIVGCVDDGEGEDLLINNSRLAFDYNILSSPTWVVNNKYETYALSADDIIRVFCVYNEDWNGCKNV